MKKNKLPKSIRKHIRREKARLRQETLNVKKREESLEELYKRFLMDKAKTGQKNEN